MARVFGAVSSSRLFWRGMSVACCCAGLLVLGSGLASAGTGSIPRPPGAIDNRGYELVSQSEKNANQLRYMSRPTEDGNRILYDLIGGVAGSPSGQALMQANRTANGWVSTSMLPLRNELLDPYYLTSAATPDLSQTIETGFASFLGQSNTDPTERFIRLDASDPGAAVEQTLLYTSPIAFGSPVGQLSASDDLSHVYVPVPRGADPSLPGYMAGDFAQNIFDLGSGTPVLVSAMPSTNQPPFCGVRAEPLQFASFRTDATTHWNSANGRFVFFTTRGDDPSCSAPVELYVRDRAGNSGAGSTTLISGPPVGADADNGVNEFLSASADGSRVFFRTATSLDPRDDADGVSDDMDIYQWTASGGNVCITCAVVNANVSTGTRSNAVVSQDGSHVYFGSAAQLADAPGPSPFGNAAPNLYVWDRASNTVHFIALTFSIGDSAGLGSQATHDGETFVYRGFVPAAATNSCFLGAFGFCLGYNRYDDRTKALMCISCPPGGQTRDAPQQLVFEAQQPFRMHNRAVSDDGSIVVFPSEEPLVPEDVNHDRDLYEWHDGTVKLITDGVFTAGSLSVVPALIGLTPSGSDVFFFDFASLTADAGDGSSKLYDARVNGGFPPPVSPSACDGDQCQGVPSGPPALGAPSNAVGAPTVPAGAAGRFSLARVSAALRSRFARTGRLPLSVSVSGPGRVTAVVRMAVGSRSVVVGRSSKTASRARAVRLVLHLSSAARARLARQGRLRVVVGVGFSGAPGSGVRLVLVLRSSAAGR